MSLFIFLTVLQAIVAAGLVTVVLMQRSEGGGLGIGGSPGGLMSARGAADFLTRATSVLATVFVILSIVLAALAVKNTGARTVDTSLDRSIPTGPASPVQPGPTTAPAGEDPLAGAAQE